MGGSVDLKKSQEITVTLNKTPGALNYNDQLHLNKLFRPIQVIYKTIGSLNPNIYYYYNIINYVDKMSVSGFKNIDDNDFTIALRNLSHFAPHIEYGTLWWKTILDNVIFVNK